MNSRLFVLSLVVLLFTTIAFASEESDEETSQIPMGSRYWKLTLLDRKVYEKTQCLDGTPSGYWVSRGSGSGENKWVFHHQGAHLSLSLPISLSLSLSLCIYLYVSISP